LLTSGPPVLDPAHAAFYRDALATLTAAQVPFLVGGAYALQIHTGIVRHTKDIDLFVLPADCPRVLDTLAAAGYRTELMFPHWLAKAFHADAFIDVIFSSGNALCPVDAEWFAHARPSTLFGLPVRVAPAEEMIWQKAFIMERHRYDGADVQHLIRGCGAALDWPRLLRRFGRHWRVLFSHLVLFGFVYPGEQAAIPAWVLRGLSRRLEADRANPPPENLCQGTLLSQLQYAIDIEQWRYRDARLAPQGRMTQDEIDDWVAEVARG
jgi:hypothetical protein